MTNSAMARRTFGALAAISLAALAVVPTAASASQLIQTPATSASAVPSSTVIDDAVKSVSLTPANPYPGQSVLLEMTWAVPDGSQGGDTFTMDLPGELTAVTKNFNLDDDNGNTLAKAVAANGKVTFTLTDFVNDVKNVRGDAWFEVQISEQTKPGETLFLDFGSITIEVAISEPAPGGPGLGYVPREDPHKGGYWFDPETGPTATQGELIRYKVESPTGAFDNLHFEDTVNETQTFVCDGEFAPLVNFEDVDSEGNSGNARPAPAESIQIDCDPQSSTLNVHVTDVPEGTIASLWYVVNADIDGRLFLNTASVTADNTTKDVSTTIKRTDAGGGSGWDGNNQPTEPPVEPTEPPVEPTEPPVEPTEPPVEPTEPPVEPTEPPVEPTPTAPEPTPGITETPKPKVVEPTATKVAEPTVTVAEPQQELARTGADAFLIRAGVLATAVAALGAGLLGLRRGKGVHANR